MHDMFYFAIIILLKLYRFSTKQVFSKINRSGEAGCSYVISVIIKDLKKLFTKIIGDLKLHILNGFRIHKVLHITGVNETGSRIYLLQIQIFDIDAVSQESAISSLPQQLNIGSAQTRAYT